MNGTAFESIPERLNSVGELLYQFFSNRKLAK